MFRYLLLPLAAISFLLSACQTSQLRQYEKIHMGMEKNDVLDVMGSPMTTTRLHGKDRWIYVFYNDGIRFEKEVHFMSGNVVYFGEPWAPPAEKTAVATDAKNETLTKEAEAKEAERNELRKANPEAYSNFEKAARGQDSKVNYLPDFVEIK